jgi:hypothetical protein
VTTDAGAAFGGGRRASLLAGPASSALAAVDEVGQFAGKRQVGGFAGDLTDRGGVGGGARGAAPVW